MMDGDFRIRSDQRSPMVKGWIAVLFSYLVIFGALLVTTDGLPYVVDNNESFSSLVHARNMADFDVGRSYGLTDESYATTAEGHPYIHSHQGNFPRIFAFLIYVLGARSIEAQIWVTTFTIGLAAIWLTFCFTRRLGGPLLATLVCMVLMTDYVLFTQWHVNTYRVWHAFFFFSSLECVHLAESKRRRLGWALATLNFAGLFYGEYVFGAFIGAMAALYALAIHWGRWRALAHTWSAGFVGAVAAAGTLLLQLTAYMGWENVLKDIRYTLLARNSASDSAFAAEVNAFYDQHNILFWQNFLDVSGLRSWRAAWDGITTHHWFYASPGLAAGAVVLVAATFLARARWLGKVGPSSLSRRGLDRAWLVKFLGLSVVVYLSFAAACRWTGVSLPHEIPGTAPLLGGLSLVLIAPAAALGAAGLSLLWFGGIAGLTRIRGSRLVAAGAFLLLIAPAQAWFTPPAMADAAARLVSSAGLLSLKSWSLLTTCTLLLLATSLILLGPVSVLGRHLTIRTGPSLRFFGAVLGAVIPVYVVFTGYVFSGYLYRQAPFLVFVTDLIIGAAAAILIAAGLIAFRRIKETSVPATRANTPSGFARRLLRSSPGLAIAAAVLAYGSAWLGIQLELIRTLPPLNYRFIQTLASSPYRGASFAVNTYAAPVAVATGSWAYFESTLFSGQVSLTSDGWSIPRDHQYLWFADRSTNPDYAKPDYALTIVQPAGAQQSLDREEGGNSVAAAETSGLVRRAQEAFQPFLHYTLTSSDQIHYSIVKLDWDFPPFLRAVDDEILRMASALTLPQKLSLSTKAADLRRRWRIELSPAELMALDANVTPVTLLELSVDGSPITPAGEIAEFWATSVRADTLRLRFATGPNRRAVRISINDRVEVVDLHTESAGERTFELTSSRYHGRYTTLPSFPQGSYVKTVVYRERNQPMAEVTYEFAQQEGSPEEASVVRIYQEEQPGRWRVVDSIHYLGPDNIPLRLESFRASNPDTVSEHLRALREGDTRTYEQWLADHLTAHPGERSRPGILSALAEMTPAPPETPRGQKIRRIPLPTDTNDPLQISVVPGTRSKAGPEYFGLPFRSANATSAERSSVALEIPTDVSLDDPPFGRVKIRLRFPVNRWPQSEPILATGVNEAGDFIYVQYVDDRHIRIGFDHWFKGGPLSEPIAIDFSREHEIDVTMGSLFPPSEDIIFAGLSPGSIAEVKKRIRVTLNGRTVIDSVADTYESAPDQVSVGANTIGGTSSGPIFTGQILSTQRIWPESP